MRAARSCIRGTLLFASLGAFLASLGSVRAQSHDASLFEALKYRSIGPHKGSRVTAVAGVVGQPYSFYFGGTGGGVWKTTDAGGTWQNVSDAYFKTGSVGAIAVAESDPNVVYVGTGSACIRGNVSPGIGVYRSTDAGRSWTHVGLSDAGQIGRVRVHPKNPDLVYVAALGHAFGRNEERGVFRSTDGGTSWKKLLYLSDRTGVVDLAMDASNPRVLYAALWTAERKPWEMISGSAEGGIYKTSDGGDSWSKLTRGLPTGMTGRIGVAVSPANPDRVWALIEAEEGGVFRSEDGGERFQRINTDRELQNRPWYYMHIYADPRDENVVYIASRYFHKSVDGGRTFQPLAMPHGDNHDLWLNPANSQILIEGNDGGASVSLNGGRSWSSQLNQPTAEMYRVYADNQFPYRVYGSQQDTYGVLSVPSRSASFGAKLQLQHWDMVGGMEGGVAVVHSKNPNIVYAGSTSGEITRYDRATGQMRPIKAYPETGGMPAKYLRHRFQRTAPIRLSPHDPEVLYHASHVVHKSVNGGQSWTVISPDLTRNDREKQSTFGGPITREVTSEEVYCTIFAFEESPHTPGLLWAGSDDGLVHISRNAGASWENVTPAAMPEWGTVNTIELSPHAPGRAFLAVQRYRLDDFKPYVFRTDDYGKSWKLLTDGKNGIPPAHFVRVVREDPDRRGLLYAGTEFGMYVSFDDGARWQSLQLNLPVTPITDLVVHQKDLVLSTQGRSFWILDDLSPLHQITDAQPREGFHLFKPRDVYRIQTSEEERDDPYVGGAEHVSNLRDLLGGARIERQSMGTDAPDGAIIYTYFREEPREEVTLEILDANGKVVHRFSSTDQPGSEPAKEPPWPPGGRIFARAGSSRFVWNLRYPAAPGANRPGPKAIPGTYRVRLTAGGRSQSQSFELRGDPRLSTTEAEYRAQFDLLNEVGKGIGEIRNAASTIRDVREQVQAFLKRLRELGEAQPFEETAGSLTEKLDGIEQTLVPTDREYRVGQLDFPPALIQEWNDLYQYVGAVDAGPTDGAYERLRDLKSGLDEQLGRLRSLLEKDLETLNGMAREKGLGPVFVGRR
jgi:hypothetical protein